MWLTLFHESALCYIGVYARAGSGSEISKKWRSATNEKPEMSRYLPKNTKTGDFNTQRTLSGSFFVIPERLASIRAVGLAFTANKQTNTLNYIYRYIIYIYIQTRSLYLSYMWGSLRLAPITHLSN